MSKMTVTAPLGPIPVGPYSHAVVANGMVFASGMVGLVPATKKLAPGGIEAQTAQALENLRAVLEASGSGLDSVVKTTVFMTNLNDFTTMNGVYATYFWRNQPARSTVQVAALPLGALVEIEAIAVLSSD